MKLFKDITPCGKEAEAFAIAIIRMIYAEQELVEARAYPSTSFL